MVVEKQGAISKDGDHRVTFTVTIAMAFPAGKKIRSYMGDMLVSSGPRNCFGIVCFLVSSHLKDDYEPH